MTAAYGAFDKRTHAAYRNLSSELMRRMLKRAFPDLNEDYCSFRAIHEPLAKQLDRFGLNRPAVSRSTCNTPITASLMVRLGRQAMIGAVYPGVVRGP